MQKKAIIEKTISGIRRAQKDYEDWSGLWLYDAPEYIQTVYIAEEINKEIKRMGSSMYLMLEGRVKTTMKEAGTPPGRPRRSARRNGNYDITLWRDGVAPIGLIEVKKSGLFSDQRKDISRVADFLKTETARYGLIAFYTWHQDPKRGGNGAKAAIEKRIKKSKHKAINFLGERYKLSGHHKITVDGDSAWAACVLQIQYRAS